MGREGAGEHAGGAAPENKKGKSWIATSRENALLAMMDKGKTTFGAAVSSTRI